jgi:CHAD domain-containing protein
MKEVLERETKWEVDEAFALPRLDDVISGASVERSCVELNSEYYDTADGDLQAHGVLLRRRDGDDDTGWQLKVPATDGRVEIHASLTDTPPTELTDLLTGLRLGKPLVNVATIRTVRERYRITEAKQRQLFAELADDHVRASVDHRLLAWREIEVELGPTAKALPRDIAKLLKKAGATPSRYPSKLARVSHAARPQKRTGSDAELAFSSYVSDQIDDIFAGDLGLRRGSDPIHDTRVAIRRLRSTLRVFGKLLDGASIAGVDDELKWFAGLLGEVRDCQVQRARFRDALAQYPDALVLGPVANRIDTDLHSEQLKARQTVTKAMASQRYLDLLTLLQQWRNDPPTSEPPNAGRLTKRARRAERKADRRLTEAVESGEDALLHRARKASKRARYAAELRAPLDKSAKKTVKHYKKIQRVLGDHQDGVVATGTLRRLALVAGTTPGENGFTYGLLYAREQQAAEKARHDARKLLG